MSAKIRYNTNHSGLEIEIGELKFAEAMDQTDESIILDDETGAHLVTTEHADFYGLEPNTVYQLVKVTTIIGAEEDFRLDDDDEDDEESAEDLN